MRAGPSASAEGPFHRGGEVFNTIRLLLWPGVVGVLQLSSTVPDTFFDTPSGLFACHQLDVTAADSAASVFEFVDGESRPRETRAAFDSSGAPLYMTVQSVESKPAVSIGHNVAVRFASGGIYLRIEKPIRNGEIIHTALQVTAEEELSADEMKKSRILALWLWAHRCAALTDTM